MRTTGALRLTCLWFTGKGKQAPMNILRTDPTSRPALAAWTRAWRVVGCFVAAVLVASHAFAQSASGSIAVPQSSTTRTSVVDDRRPAERRMLSDVEHRSCRADTCQDHDGFGPEEAAVNRTDR